MIGGQDILIALAVGMIFFGAKKLPELARGLGESLKEFKKATTQPDEPPVPAPAPDPRVAPAAGNGSCATCQATLQAEWMHCPKCGAAVRGGDPVASAERRTMSPV